VMEMKFVTTEIGAIGQIFGCGHCRVKHEVELTRRTHQLVPSAGTQGGAVAFWDSQVSSSLHSVPRQSLREKLISYAKDG